ncbi:hypothetical protein [Pseudobythopirellula maris]|uniref:hypothetical protein n=1 Tax=Pseudobythopirellula maris TaxID=2527991 RepID=UPI0011B54A4B|nr:hypothetical protein [Pseudobythopirellula maris]
MIFRQNAGRMLEIHPLRRPIIFVTGVSPNFDNRFWPRAQQRFLATRHFVLTAKATKPCGEILAAKNRRKSRLDNFGFLFWPAGSGDGFGERPHLRCPAAADLLSTPRSTLERFFELVWTRGEAIGGVARKPKQAMRCIVDAG